MWGRVFNLVLKELQQLRRDRAAKFRLLIPTLVQLFIFGYAATFEVYNVATVVLDLDHTQESRDLISRFAASGRFEIVRTAKNAAEIRQAIDRADAVVAIVIQAGFAEDLRKGLSAPAQVIVDGTNSNTALIALSYVSQIVATYAQETGQDLARREHAAAPPAPTVTLEARPWYNVDFNSRWFFVPGVIATLTLIMIVNLTSFAVVREREVGTLEQIMVTPIRPLEFILGKTIPYFLVGLALTIADRRRRHGLVSGAVPRQSVRPLDRNLVLSPLGARDRPPDLDRLPHPAAGVRHQLLRHQPRLHPVGLQLPDRQHAAGHAMAVEHQPDDLLPRRHPRDVPERRGPRRAVAADGGARGARRRAAGDQRLADSTSRSTEAGLLFLERRRNAGRARPVSGRFCFVQRHPGRRAKGRGR